MTMLVMQKRGVECSGKERPLSSEVHVEREDDRRASGAVRSGAGVLLLAITHVSRSNRLLRSRIPTMPERSNIMPGCRRLSLWSLSDDTSTASLVELY